LEQELVRSCLLPVRLKDGSPVSNWIGDAAGGCPCPGLGAEVLDSLNAAVAKLDAEERVLLYQLWVEGQSLEQIAEEGGLKPNTVRGHVNTVIDRLSEYMEKR
jgi:DNA-directed RNA polymerase specialized sigma24 family protein